jgi:hypothetical protein
MKKILVLLALFILLGTISATAVTIEERQTTPKPAQTGTFTGEVGYQKDGEWNKVGDLSGTYEQKNRFYKFNGNWEITVGEKTGSGTMVGIFGKHILYGRITISESGKKAPIIGFIGVNQTSQQFIGRAMSIVGPALYFKGTYL